MLGRSYPNSFYKLASHKLLKIVNLSQSSINQIRNTYKNAHVHMYTVCSFYYKIYENPLSDFGEVAMIICSSSILNCGQAFKFRKGHNSLKK